MKISKIFTLFAVLLLVYSCQNDLHELPNEQEIHKDHNHEADLRQVTLEDWEPMECADISIFIEDCGQGWTDGVLAAMDAYNDLDAAIIMSTASSAGSADIVITCVDIWLNNLSGLVGLGEWPVDDFTVGGQIYLNTDYDDCNDPCFFKGFAMHELGHNLGLAHDHQDGVNLATGTWEYNPLDGLFTHTGGTSAFGEHIPGTPTSDPNSIFLSFLPACGTATVCDFSAGDELAFELLYPEVNCDGGGGGEDCVGECPNVDLKKIDVGEGCGHWRVGLSNDSDCEYYFDITNPPPFSSSTGNIIPAKGQVNFQTGTICCDDGPIIINIYTLGPNGEKQYCEPIVLTSCEEECEGMEECMEVGFREHFDCQLRAYFNECTAFTNGNSSFTWQTPAGVVSGGIFVNAFEDGVYCLTVTFKNGCILTDCIIVEGCSEATKL